MRLLQKATKREASKKRRGGCELAVITMCFTAEHHPITNEYYRNSVHIMRKSYFTCICSTESLYHPIIIGSSDYNL